VSAGASGGTADGRASSHASFSAILTVPPLDALPDSPPRRLAGRFAAAAWADLPDWQHDGLEQVWQAFLNNCTGLMRPVSASLTVPARAAPRVWQPVCAAASGLQQTMQTAPAPDAQTLRQFLQTHLRPWRVLDATGAPASHTVTGYFEPVIDAARQPGGRYQWPLYARPDDLLVVDLGAVYPELAGKRVRGKLRGKLQGGNVVPGVVPGVVPYDTRAQIAASNTPPPVIVWAADPVEAFFLQIQGSGRARLPDGSQIRLAYADHNGHPYVSVGKWLVEQGELTLAQASMQNIKTWAQQNPQRVQELLNVNPAVVFFREEAIGQGQPDADVSEPHSGSDVTGAPLGPEGLGPLLGPKGAYGIALTARRSIAVDAAFVPLGSPVYLSTTWPASKQPLRRLVFAQDTGAAIKGAARADFYWGTGQQAGELAGRMKQSGQMWVLWPVQAGQPAAR